ncbi:hypothetical protein [Paenibacillus cremeus]|uniref:Uncharacterized protein n=1 Tax=Paenibacillus cremeus TaxID=2163881 RepID=A0A559KC78_9BACL|nr:hypothetical protein [Paenibacillus cremeus]TVY09725.1 hypothetical protein FPZ49_11870 [Paenibacillus cremeus]
MRNSINIIRPRKPGRAPWVTLTLACALAISLTGCGSTSSGGTTPKGTAAPVQEKAKESAAQPDGKSAGSAASGGGLGITQEEVDVKFRVNMTEIKGFLDKAKPGPIIPALKQNAVPQGIGYIAEKNWIVVSHYREGGKASLLTFIDAGTGKLVKSGELYKDANTPYTGHAGGVTVSKKHVWVSSDGYAYELNLDDVVKSADQAKLVFSGSIKTDTRASLTTYAADGVLWVGEFAHGTDYPTSKTHYINSRDGKEHKAWAVGYKLDPETDLLPAAKKPQGSEPAVPDYILSLPDIVQGMAVLGDRIMLSTSNGRNAAGTLIEHQNPLSEKPHATVTIGSQTVPVWFLDSKNRGSQLQTPPMCEGVVDIQGTLGVLFESGATEYRGNGSYPLDHMYMLKLE